jgi:hypothetical protein
VHQSGRCQTTLNLWVWRALRARIADRAQHVSDRSDGSVWGDAVRRIPSGCRESALAGVRVGPVLHPAVLFALADGAGFLQRGDRLAAQDADRRPSLVDHQHRDRS